MRKKSASCDATESFEARAKGQAMTRPPGAEPQEKKQ